MITRIQSAGEVLEAESRLINKNKGAEPLPETKSREDFSKLLFEAFREQNRTFYGADKTAAKGVSFAGGTRAQTLYGKTGVTVSDKKLNEIFERAAEKYEIPVALVKAVAKAESDFNPKEVSSSGAMGIMQLMPETAKFLGVTDAFDPEQNIMGGARYLSDKLKMYDGNIELALAAYNAGSGNVRRYGGVPPFKETQNYIKRVLSYMETENG